MEDYEKFRSAIPPHLTPEEREEWEQEAEFERREYERRVKEGWYSDEKDSNASYLSRLFGFNKKTQHCDAKYVRPKNNTFIDRVLNSQRRKK